MSADDTPSDVRDIQRSIWMARSGSERVGMAVEMNAMARSIAISGIRSRCPGISRSELEIELIERMHGPELAAEVKRSRADGT
ncbi:MAG: hypothetical protein GXP35_04385 [Actinobacteria bacterium]|nr:hypothetical protein [Actinomycetota bacterium]